MRYLFLASVALLTLGASPMVQLPATQTISATDRAEGAKAHPDLLNEYGGAYAGPQSAYVSSVGRRVAAQSGIANVNTDFTITLLNSPVENAFAIPGGYVYCTRQLMALMNDEAELASVLGHESGHVAAHHAEKRNKVAQRDSILGTLGQVLAGAVLGNGTLGQLATKGISLGVTSHILSYSRGEEYEADDLGVVFINKAGYDPRAAGDMLTSLAAQVALDQKISGNARSTPTWASTHPDPGSRVTRALGRAQELHSPNRFRNNDVFLASLKGMIYGDDPKQGLIEGQDFKYPAARFQFTAPAGYTMSNGASAVTIAGSGGQASFSGGKITSSLNGYVDSVFKAIGGGQSNIGHSSITNSAVSGMPTAAATATAQTSNGQMVDVTVVAYAFSPTDAYHFTVIAPQGQGLGALAPLIQSFRRMTPAEAAAVRVRKVDIVKIRSGDTVASMAARMAYTDFQIERFTVLNALDPNAPLVPGRKVKLIVYG
jgi:predicted Zn-dependent protease